MEKPFVRPTYRWKDDIRMDLRELGWENMDWMHDRDHCQTLLKTVINKWIHKWQEFPDYLSDY
jgi:hypothetical protein